MRLDSTTQINHRSLWKQFQDATIYGEWLVAVRFVAPRQYQSVVVDPWDLEVDRSIPIQSQWYLKRVRRLHSDRTERREMEELANSLGSIALYPTNDIN
ncbi:hypothetical protein IQ235_15685 [Oscillatoriales cyanobacterium LEGE 11467]|uniref:Uncharacterized protein n=1 Tax=Zarconia navalis LEGE 11467 TaxID=1828826 RepID=A0A928Z942_9CYAN|nr:hypothetical protein [Zarconia navalis]MBE9042220.1 hypothetical protein [Zarconia navalis LEGE 11467]